METWFVGIGGVMGAIARYLLSKWINDKLPGHFPMATLLVNISGAFALGWLTRASQSWLPDIARPTLLFLGTGVLGAYTTFSTFSYEFTMLLESGQLRQAVTYLFTTLVIGLSAAALGLFGWPELRLQ
ncbi:fluoride efflux transporter CrcB [Alicyclobacillaceae bacterium I2511]|nr:fluoride efflux transporter CrcB [Alicyclobacillaceae bacterium I2511]